MSPSKTEPTRLAMMLDYLLHCSALHAIGSSTRKVPLWLFFLISHITWFSGPSGSHLSLSKPPRMLSFLWGKNFNLVWSHWSSITITLSILKSILFLSGFPYFQLPPNFYIHLEQKAFGHQVSVLIQAMVKQWPVLFSGVQWDQILSSEPERPWRLSHVLLLLFPGLWLHVRHTLKPMWFVYTQPNHWSSYDNKHSLSSSPHVISNGSSFCSSNNMFNKNSVCG